MVSNTSRESYVSLAYYQGPRRRCRGVWVLSCLTTLGLHYTDALNTIPEEFGELSALEILYINRGRLKSLPESLGRISSLKHVTLSGCDELESIPECWGKRSSLKQLTSQRGEGSKDLTSSELGECSSMTTDAEGMRIHVRSCELLDESAMAKSGWLLECGDSFTTTYRRKEVGGVDR
jgi:hypothetical protein